MLNVFETDKEFNEVASEFYSFISDEDIKDIDNFFNNSEYVDEDMTIFGLYCSNENDKTRKGLFKMVQENVLYSLIGFRNKSFEKTIENSSNSIKLEEDRRSYDDHWVTTFNEVKPVIVSIFKKYYEIVISKGKAEDLKEMKAIYQTICYYFFKLLPKNYQNELLKNEQFELLTCIESDFTNPNEYYISKIDYKIRNFILQKYRVDLFEEFYNIQRKSNNINKF